MTPDPTSDGGLFTPLSRRAALAQSLSSLGTWFSRGSGWAPAGVGLERSDMDTDVLLTGLRLRANVAAARGLIEAIHAMRSHMTFRYRQERLRTVEFSRGTLDVARLVTSVGVPESPQRYPIVRTLRGADTPENVLTALVALRIRSELIACLTASYAGTSQPIVDLDSNDRYQATSAHLNLDRTLQIPAIRDAARLAREVRRRGELIQIVARVERRINRREVLNPNAYRAIVTLAHDLLAGTPGASVGSTAWDFYDTKFDPRLFEIWFLTRLIDRLDHEIPVNSALTPIRRGMPGPLRIWRLPHAQVEIFFQKAPTTIDPGQTPRWKPFAGTTTSLSGIPDITALITDRITNQRTWVLIDPKLRKRKRRPAEEIFKLLGYFDNYRFNPGCRGAIVYYTPGRRRGRLDTWTDGGHGRVMAVGLDPYHERSVERALEAVASLILDSACLSFDSNDGARSPGAEMVAVRDSGELTVQKVQETTTAYLMRTATRLGRDLKPSKRHAKTALGPQRWGSLDKPTRTIIATALHVSGHLAPRQDHSAPVLGLCSATERILRARLVTPARNGIESAFERKYDNETKTLGSVLAVLRDAIAGSPKSSAACVRRYLEQVRMDLGAVGQLTDQLVDLNESLRIPAAHTEVLIHDDWARAWDLLMVNAGGTPPILRTLLDVTNPDPCESPDTQPPT